MTVEEYKAELIKRLQKEADDLKRKYHLYGNREYLFKCRQTVNIIGMIQADRENKDETISE